MRSTKDVAPRSSHPADSQSTRAPLTLDIGGEGRHPYAWNLNPSPIKTRGADRGKPIPRLILGRAEAIPLPQDSVDLVIVERTPLRVASYKEIHRVISHGGTIVLRHALLPNHDPHQLARKLLSGSIFERMERTHSHWLQETVFLLCSKR